MPISLKKFVYSAFSVLHPGQTLEPNWHINKLCGVLQTEIERLLRGEPKTQDIIINIPPRSLKSFITSVCLPVWTWSCDSRVRFISTSYSQSLSEEHALMSRRLVESDWFIDLTAGQVVLAHDQCTKVKYETTEYGMRRATSTGGTITGTGADVIIVDDIINPTQAASDTRRNAANSYFSHSLSSRLNNPSTGLFIIVMQRLHEDDLTGYLLN